tara:strand:- start:73 stop:225 length:153 start_codon:yes stop_codon:yes gene_type:complete
MSGVERIDEKKRQKETKETKIDLKKKRKKSETPASSTFFLKSTQLFLLLL